MFILLEIAKIGKLIIVMNRGVSSQTKPRGDGASISSKIKFFANNDDSVDEH